jgi:small nuclear ribonucleoprotein (snRNP)-like protein
VDHILEQDTENWKHKFVIISEDEPKKKLPEMELHFIELSKCRKRTKFDLKDPLDRWVKFLIDPTFIKTFSMQSKKDYPNLKKAVLLLDESNYTEGQLIAYDNYLSSIMSWNTNMIHHYEEGKHDERKLILTILNDIKKGKADDEIISEYQIEKSFLEQLKLLVLS